MNWLDTKTVLCGAVIRHALRALMLLSLWRQHRRRSSGLGWSLAALTFGAYAVVSIARIVADLAVPTGHDLFQTGLYDTLAIPIYQALSVALTFALFLMVNHRLFDELAQDIRARERAEAALRWPLGWCAPGPTGQPTARQETEMRPRRRHLPFHPSHPKGIQLCPTAMTLKFSSSRTTCAPSGATTWPITWST